MEERVCDDGEPSDRVYHDPPIYSGRQCAGWRRDFEAGRDSWRGFKDFVATCRPLRWQAVIAIVAGIGGYLRGFSAERWWQFALMVFIGLVAEAINTALEATLTRLGQEAWIQRCMIAGRVSCWELSPLAAQMLSNAAMSQEELATIGQPDFQVPQLYDPGIGRAKDLAAAIVMVAFLSVAGFLTYFLIVPH